MRRRRFVRPSTRALTVLALGLASATVCAEEALSAALDRCAALQDPEIRIRCFESLDRAPPDDGDGVAISRPRPAEPPRVTRSRVEDLQRRPRGEYVFLLANGQTWTEIEPGTNAYQPGMPVRIEPTVSGGHMLTTAAGRATRVRLLD